MRTWRRFRFGLTVGGAAGVLLLALSIVSARQQNAGRQPPAVVEGSSVTQLPDGRWLVLGGREGGASRRAAILDPSTGTQVPLAATLIHRRAGHTATVLPDGTILVIGGRDGAEYVEVAERFDPSTGLSTPLPMTGSVSRSLHTATLLTDGRVLLAGGTNGGLQPVPIELWDLQTQVATPFAGELANRTGHRATLLRDGRVLINGGRGADGDGTGVPVVVDTNGMTVARDTAPQPEDAPPTVALSSPAAGETGVPASARIVIRFSEPLRMETLNRDTIRLVGEQGALATTVVGAEGGTLAFVWPLDPLVEGATYVVTVTDAASRRGMAVLPASISFTIAEPPRAPDVIEAEAWTPTTDSAAGGWKTNRSPSPWESLAPLLAPAGVTAVSGRVLTLDGRPLPGVTMAMNGASAESDRTGRFLLRPSVGAGRHVLDIDGATASRPGRKYGFFEYGLTVAPGQTTVLPFTIWMPKLDIAHQVRIPSPTTSEVVVTTPLIPGLELHLPAGTTIRGEDGKPVTEVSITPIPIDRPPFPLPSIQVPVYFTIQPGGAYVSTTGPQRGARLVYPNYKQAWPGKRIQFFHYDPEEKDWFVYGLGTVTADAKQVTPDSRTRLYEFTGAMINSGAAPPPDAPPPGDEDCGCGGDPVSLTTGLFSLESTDLVMPDVLPLTLKRTYRQRDLDVRPFGVGSTHPYAMFLYSALQYSEADLVLPDGARVHFVRTSAGTGFADAVFTHEERPSASPPTAATPTPFYKSTLGWNGNGWDLRLNDGTVYVFGDEAPLQSIRDRFGNTVRFTWSSTNGHGHGYGNLLRLTSPNGRWIDFTYDTSNRITQATDNIGRIVIYTYDAGGNLATVTDPENHVTSYTYDTEHRMLTVKSPPLQGTSANLVVNTYDTNPGSPTLGWVTKQTLADGGTYQFAYTVTNGKSTQTDVTNPRGFVRRVTFNSDGYAVGEIEALGQPEQQTKTFARQNGNHFMSSSTDALNRQTTVTYDVRGNILSLTRLAGTADAVTTTYTYEQAFDQVATITDPLNHTTRFGYDAFGNRVTVTDPLNHTVTLTYDSRGQMTSVTDPLQHSTQVTYAGADPVVVTDALGRTTRRFVDAVGRVLSQTDASGQIVRSTYDRLNHVTSTTDHAGNLTSFGYDPAGRLTTVTDARNNVTTHAHDVFNRMISRTDPLSQIEAYTFDLNGNPTQQIDRKGQPTTRTYDAVDRLHQAVYADGSTMTFGYDAGNRLITIADSSNGTVTRTYDGLDRLTSETTPQGSVSYTYDAADRRLTRTVSGQPAVTYGYDDANKLTSVTQGSSVVTITYDSADRRGTVTLPNGIVVTYGYDAANQLESLTYVLGPSSLGTLSYSYDALGRRTAVGGTWARTLLPSSAASATYDAANRLTQWSGNTQNYDANGNLLSDGLTNYTWNARNELVSIGGAQTATFAYGATGLRTAVGVAGASTSTLYDGFDPVQTSTGGSTVNRLPSRRLDESFASSDATGLQVPLVDALGSIVALTDASGNVQTQYAYEAFGRAQATGPATPNKFTFTGREDDGVGLLYFRARYYHPGYGRFLSQDPLGLAAGPNLYAYVDGDPINVSDQLGLEGSDRTEVVRGIWNVGLWDAWKGYDLSGQSSGVAQQSGLPGAHNGPQDAFRHCLWSCLMTEAMGADQAKAIADEHENAGDRQNHQPKSERLMDEANNDAGRQCGSDSGGGKSGNKPGANKPCKDKCWDRLTAGQLFGPNGIPIPAQAWPRPNGW